MAELWLLEQRCRSLDRLFTHPHHCRRDPSRVIKMVARLSEIVINTPAATRNSPREPERSGFITGGLEKVRRFSSAVPQRLL